MLSHALVCHKPCGFIVHQMSVLDAFPPAAMERWIETGVGVGADIGAPVFSRFNRGAELGPVKVTSRGLNGDATPPPAVS